MADSATTACNPLLPVVPLLNDRGQKGSCRSLTGELGVVATRSKETT